jgi:hypothetical protein
MTMSPSLLSLLVSSLTRTPECSHAAEFGHVQIKLLA